MKKSTKVISSVVAICLMAVVCINMWMPSAQAYSYGSDHQTGNLTSFTGKIEASTVNKSEDITLTTSDRLRANAGQLQIYGYADYWRQACAWTTCKLTFTYYNSSGGKISSTQKIIDDEYFSTGGWKHSLKINWTKVPANTAKIRVSYYCSNSLTVDPAVKNIKIYLKDTTAPVYSVCAPVTSPAKYKMGTKIRYQVVFSEPVNVSSSGYLNFKVGSQEINSKSVYAGQSSDKTTLYYDFTLPETSTTGDNLAVTLTSISGLSVKDDAQYSVTVNKTLNLNNGFYVDNKPPAVKSMTSDASTGAVYKLGEKLVFDVTFTENVWVTGSPYISLSNGKKATYVKKTSSDTNICSFEYVIGEGDDAEALAITGISFAGIGDAVKNSATSAPGYNANAYNNFMDGRNVCIDTIAPTVEFPETTEEWAKEHKVTLIPTDNISGVKALYAVWAQGDEAPIYPEAPNVDMETYQISTPKASGTYKLYVKAEDIIGNTAAFASPYTYMTDYDLPVIEKAHELSGELVKSVTATATDIHSGVEGFTYRWINEAGAEVLKGNVEEGIKKPDTDGVYKIELTATDKVGNKAIETIENLKVDSIAPKVEFTPNGNSEYLKSHGTEAKVTDEKAGVKEYYYLWSESASMPEENNENWVLAQTNIFTTPENKSGTYYLHIKATDNVDNTSITTSEGFNIDNAGPEVTLTPNNNKDFMGETSCDVRIQLADKVSIASEISAWYSVTGDKENYGEFLQLTDEVVTIETLNTAKYLIVKAVDKAGNETIYTSDAYLPDLTAPTGTIEKTEDKYYTNSNTVSVKLSVDDDYSDKTWMQIKIDETEMGWEDFETAKTLDFAKTEGEHEIFVRFKDKSGNISEYQSVTYFYDVTAPEITLDYSNQDLTNEAVTVVATAEDETSEVTFITETEKTFDVNGSFEFVVCDEAGNIARKIANIENIDKTKPTITVTSPYFDGKKHKDAKITISADDENGISDLEYAISEQGTQPTEMIKCKSGDEIYVGGLDGIYYVTVNAVDLAGNTETLISQTVLFDNTIPEAEISYEPATRTARDVVATITFNEDVKITNNSGSNTYTFTENGEFTFEFKDEAGNKSTKTASVTWIDRAQPTAKVILSQDGWTTEDITVTLLPQPQSIIQNVKFKGEAVEENDLNTYTFTEYGNLEYEIYDIETEVITKDSVVIKIDRNAPQITEIHYSATDWTNNDVSVTVSATDDLSEITYVNGKTHIFTENGEFTFKIKDEAGNITEETVVVDFIDKSAPIPTVTYYVNGREYDTSVPTNQNVTAKVTFDDGGAPVEIQNNDGSFEYEFSANGSFTFIFKDQAGNSGEVTALVSEIDKIAPTGYVTYSKSSWTNTDVIATLHTSDDKNQVIITNNQGENYTFTQNGEFNFEFKDEAGNIASVKAETQIIDKTAPTLSYTLSTADPTPFSVFATVTADEKVTFINNDGKATRQFKTNGEYKFEAVDKAGNKAEINVLVENISKETTAVKIVYSETEATNQDVLATIEAADGKTYIYVTNNDGKKTFRFTENGEFTFTYKNAAGIEGEATASVTNIDKIAPTVTVTYSHDTITNENVIATFMCQEDVELPYIVVDGKYTFTENNKIQFPVKDKAGNITNVIAETNLIDKNAPVIEIQNPCGIIALGNEFSALSGVSVTDESDIDGDIFISGSVDTDQAGSYTLTYNAKDIAGNMAKAQKTVTVYDPDKFNVFVNDLPALGNQISIKTKQLDIDAMNVTGALKIKYLPGKKYIGDFKTKGTEIATDSLLPSEGYYTIYMMDDDRNAAIVNVFVQE